MGCEHYLEAIMKVTGDPRATAYDHPALTPILDNDTEGAERIANLSNLIFREEMRRCNKFCAVAPFCLSIQKKVKVTTKRY